MDPYEATKAVFSRVQSLDPENASKIMGLLLIQDHGEKEMIRLAFGPENLLHSVVVKARQELGISPNTPSTNTNTPCSTPSSPSPFLYNNNNNSNTNNNNSNNIINQNPLCISRQNSTCSSNNNNGHSSRFVPIPNGLKIPTSLNLSSLGSPCSNSSPSCSWGASVFDDYDYDLVSPSSKSSSLNPSTPPFYTSSVGGAIGIGTGTGTGRGPSPSPRGDLMDEIQLHDQLSFLNDSAAGAAAAAIDKHGGGGGGSATSAWSDMNMLDDPSSGLGWKPCLYYARGFCKNGSSCRFVHAHGSCGGLSDSDVGSPSKLEMMEQCHELLRSKSMQHQKQLMAAMASVPGPVSGPGLPTFPYSMNNNGLSLFAQHQQNDSPRAAAAAAALMMGEDLHKFSRSRLDNGRADSNPASRQIYLTFPADSTFREEDVSNYFSIYGPVQDVRIPYQQKRMFGFVTFVYPDTVKIILAKGNPHFVCDARVLVKPYKEKGKVPDKFRKQQQQQQMERGEFSSCNSPTALDSRDPFDIQLGARMMYDTQTQYMLWKRKLEEQADLQQALELQSRRLMGLQLLDVKRNHHHRSLSTGAMIQSPTQSPNSIFNQPPLGSDRSSPDASDENCASPPLNEARQALQQAINEATDREKEGPSVGEDNNNNGNGNVKEGPCHEDNNLPESLEHNLPDSPFASPTKGGGEYMTAFSGGTEVESTSIPAVTSANNTSKASTFFPASSTLDLPSFKSCYVQMPRFSPGHGAIGM